jgi:hypothetical protein
MKKLAHRLNNLFLNALENAAHLPLLDKIEILYTQLAPKADALVVLWKSKEADVSTTSYEASSEMKELELAVEALQKPLHLLMVKALASDRNALRIPRLKIKRDKTDGRRIEELLDVIQAELDGKKK